MPRLAFGGDYNPDQWDRDVWREDVRLMQRAGVNLVSLGIFSWSWIEPEQDRFDFSGLDEVIALLHEGGVAVDLATPSASPPPWFSAEYPDAEFVDHLGRRLGHGSRQGFCPSSPDYRRRTAVVANRLARRYGEHPAVVMWHVGNEIGGYNAHCHCPTSAEAFRHWLRDRHGDLDGLNRAWGTAFWSQRYSDWSQVRIPGATPGRVNPAQQLDHYRFASDELLDCYRTERDVLRRHSPGRPVTTNFMAGTFKWVDYCGWGQEVDLVTNDHYLVAADPEAHTGLAFSADLSRGIAGGRPWLLMEHSTSAVQWQPRNTAKRPGEMLRNSLAHIARGSDGACFFQWRQSDSGVEKWHSAMVPHGGESTRIWQEVVRLGAALRRIGEVAGSTVTGEVALLWDYENWWALELGGRPSVDLEYAAEAEAWHRAVWRQGVVCDVLPADVSAEVLSRYRLVLLPSHYLTTPGTVRALTAYVHGGGHLLAGPFSGLVDRDDRLHPGPFPGALRDLLGLTVDEFLPLREGAALTLDDGLTGRVWAEAVHPDGAHDPEDPDGVDGVDDKHGTVVDARFADGPAAGGPALLRRRAGAGLVRYAATRFEDSSLRTLLAGALDEAGVRSTAPGAGDGVEVVRRTAEDGRSWLFVLNHTDDAAEVACRGVELLSNATVPGLLTVAAGEVAVVRESGTSDVG
ncbi:beta-galactosidase [Kitasatospora purpeofusca]|uniref:beta-galactosidase n=1 Tax=Kitasatospora purpeofusca TaxID=67352 RepID=UPI003658427D